MKSHSKFGISSCPFWSTRNERKICEILKFVCLSNKGTQFQIKGGISDGALRVTYVLQ